MNTPHFTRQTHNTSYVAYASAASKKPQNLLVGDQRIQARIHPDVFINEYTEAKIKEVVTSDDTANIKVDAKSIVTSSGKTMKYDFGGNVKVNSPIYNLAVEAQNTGRPVYIALETRRKYRSRGGEVIPYTVPIHVLRGCEDGPQSAGQSNATGNNCSKIVAAMGWADEPNVTLISDEAHSNPCKWDVVRANQEGDLPPKGFVIPALESGDPVGGIIAAPAQAPAADDSAVRREIAELKKMVAHLQRSGGNGSGAGLKPWHERQEDGSVNPSSYAVTQVRHTRATAARVVAGAVGDTEVAEDVLREVESSLTRVLLWIADGVQQAVAGGNDRMAKSYTEAGAWVEYVIDVEDPYTEDLLGDDDAAKQKSSAWAKRVRTAATERYREAVAVTAEHLGDVSGVPTPQTTDASHDSDDASAETSFADDHSARQLWDQLIQSVGMVDYIDQLNPALTARFGTHLSTEIPARAMREALSEWLGDPQSFRQWAGEQFNAVNSTAA